MKITVIAFLVSFIFSTLTGSSQEKNKAEYLNFYLDCHDCDFDFVRQELSFISFVRDPGLADVHILSSESDTGGGGKKYFLNFIGYKLLSNQNFEYQYLATQDATDHEIRKGLLTLIKSGIVQYYALSGILGTIDIDLENTTEPGQEVKISDPWNLWVFNIEAGSDFEFEASQNEYSLATEISIKKVTEGWKTETEANNEIYRENYTDDGEKIQNRQNRLIISSEYIKSLSPKWSAGIIGEYNSENYINIKNAFQFQTGVEYNIFPWDISNRKVFALRYVAGVHTFTYNEETIYDKQNETLMFEALMLNLELVQPWGRMEISLEGSHYFNDFSKNRVTLESDFSVRLSKQLSVYCELQALVIHDQLYLPKGDASLEDVLLKRKKLATTYEISGEAGLRFTFGSIYNNVVNERF